MKPLKLLWQWIDTRIKLTQVLEKIATGYPVPENLNFWYSMGSVLIVCFMLQIITGILLLIYYVPETSKAFQSVQLITHEIPMGWFIRRLHAITANAFVVFLFLHMLSVLFMGSYKTPRELHWVLGVVIFALVLTECLSGYLLPWSQLSYWATTVATNSLGSIPLIGGQLVSWVRGSEKVTQLTLGRFFSLHVSFIPFTIFLLIAAHIFFMRRTGISYPPGSDENKVKKVPFFPHMVVEDLKVIYLFFALLFLFIFFYPQISFPPDALEPANPLETPAHIKPEWYFLANYQILKLIPNEFLGILAQGIAFILILLLPFLDRGEERYPLKRPFFTTFGIFAVLVYLGLIIWGKIS